MGANLENGVGWTDRDTDHFNAMLNNFIDSLWFECVLTEFPVSSLEGSYLNPFKNSLQKHFHPYGALVAQTCLYHFMIACMEFPRHLSMLSGYYLRRNTRRTD